MYQDIDNGRNTEIDYLNGYLCKLATEAGVACEENQRLVDSIKQLESQAADKHSSL
jgi:2-dehydropantoate 2-reductase